jgi:hypothetical protein
VPLQSEGIPPEAGWTIQRAEELLRSLPGVVSVSVVARPGGEIEEIHLLTSLEVSPKQTVRNVESALKAQFSLKVDHRKISVAQTADKEAAAQFQERNSSVLIDGAGPRREGRILFLRHSVETERSHRVRISVSVEWAAQEFVGEAAGADLPRSRLEISARATLLAVEAALASPDGPEDGAAVVLALDGVKMVEAFDRRFALVAANAMHDREITALAGAASVEETPERAVIMAVLQATDRWVRGRL